MPEWEAEIEVDEPLAVGLIGAQFPDLKADALRRIGEGWDYTIWATADDVAFRFPRRQAVIESMRREMAILPWLSDQLGAMVPDAHYQGVEGNEFPWPFFGSQLIAGSELTEAENSITDRNLFARDLGQFLRALHALTPPNQLNGVIDPNHRADMQTRVPRTRAIIDQIRLDWPAARQSGPILDAAEQVTTVPPMVLSHGDLHMRQILISDQGRLGGVVDWVDVCVAPASVDLSVVWGLFSPSERESFFAVYGPVDQDSLLRARALALFFGATLAVYARDRGHTQLWNASLATLDRTLRD